MKKNRVVYKCRKLLIGQFYAINRNKLNVTDIDNVDLGLIMLLLVFLTLLSVVLACNMQIYQNNNYIRSQESGTYNLNWPVGHQECIASPDGASRMHSLARLFTSDTHKLLKVDNHCQRVCTLRRMRL